MCGALRAGAVATETVFFWPGAGRLPVDSSGGRDYPVVLLSALAFMASALLVDVADGWLDPRSSYSR